MHQPATPTKGAAAEKLTKTIDHFSARWGLLLPRQDAQWSPSKNPHEQCIEEKIVARIKFLIFKNQNALENALEGFEQSAMLISKGWKFKPKADDGVLPLRESATGSSLAGGGGFLRRTAVDPHIINELMESLFSFVDQAAERVKKNLDQGTSNDGAAKVANSGAFAVPASKISLAIPDIPQDTNSRSFSGAESAQWNGPQQKKQSLPYRYLTVSQENFDNNLGHMHVSSSNEFDPDHDTSSIMEDITMIGTPDLLYPKLAAGPGPIQDKTASPDDEVFITPPTSPCITDPSDGSLIDPQLQHESELDEPRLFLQQTDLIQLPKFTQSKKRPFPEPIKPSLPRKASRGDTKLNSSNLYNVNSLRPTIPSFRLDDPFRNYHDTVSASGLVTVPDLRRSSTSFDSVSTAATTLTASSAAWSATRSLASISGSTTPNTSFRSDSLATSFNSNQASFYKTEVPHQVAIPYDLPESKPTVRSAPNTPRAKRSNATFQRSATTSDVDAQADNTDPMEIDQSRLNVKLESFSEYLGDTFSAKGIFSTNIGVGGLSDRLRSLSLLPIIDSLVPSAVPFRQLYEVTRVSLFCNLPSDLFSSCLTNNIDDYEKLWSSLGSITTAHKANLPERSSLRAWEMAHKSFENVSLTGDLKFPDHASSSIFQLSLKPLKMEQSYRLARKFGGDRFCIIGIPGIDRLPPYLKANSAAMRARIVNLLTHTDIVFLSRRWRAFYLKPNDTKKTRRGAQNYFNDTKYRVYFFARDGDGFSREGAEPQQGIGTQNHPTMKVEELLNWFMPFKNNLKQPCLKFFARLALGVSKTIPTIQFESFEIVRTSDARADVPAVRRLTPQSAEEREMQEKTSQSKAPVMNDGCARISKAAALAIAKMLELTQVPCVFQGRIGGAKGIWIVDALDEVWPRSTRNFWIEIIDSQMKFEKHQLDAIYPDPARVTFEVNSYSKSLSSKSLNFQLMPILAHQGVPMGEFERLLEEDLTAKIDELGAATDSSLSLRKWNQDNNHVGLERVMQNGIQMQGGLPDLSSEKINWFIDHGFEPGSCSFLKDLLFRAIKEYCLKLENKMNIAVGKSAYAFMVADPLAILEENEIHLGFSSNFRDPKDDWEQVLLHETDVLVARLPALLSSDVQKVRAVFKPELQLYKDVIVFSSKGARPLADKLSGGDYDGDHAWICWEPTIVAPFSNSSVPIVPALEAYGIQKDTTKVGDVIEHPDYASVFLQHAFNFNLQADMLGSCTAYHESLCYSGTSIDDPKAVAIAALLGHLVDRPKSGIIFDEPLWLQFLKRNKLRPRLEKPAYKDKEKARPTSHMIDKLVFVTAKAIREKALKEFSAKFAQVGTWDEDLVRPWNSELEVAQNDRSLERALTDLKAGLSSITDFWVANARIDDGEEWRVLRKPRAQLSFAAVLEKCREDFLNLAPTCPPETSPSSTLGRWAREWKNGRGGHWALVKASALFHKYHKGRMAWHVAGVELGEIKAMARGRGTYRLTVSGVFTAMKLDGRLVNKIRRMELQREETNEAGVDDDEYGVWDWDE